MKKRSKHSEKNSYTYDVLIVGSGASGLSLALSIAKSCRVAVLSKEAIDSGSTRWAQGGIAGVIDSHDSINSHVEDTLNAGAGLCHKDVVQFMVERSRSSIEWLIDQGVDFTPYEEDDARYPYHLTKEGGHSHRRIIHAADATGLAVSSSLQDQALNHPNIDCFNHHMVVDLILREKLGQGTGCVGAYVLDRQSEHIKRFMAPFVVIAAGGASRVYLYTTNPDGATGDGIALAWRAGCEIANMEFNQFHPTCLYHPEDKSFLISEAVRGEGGQLKLPDGSRFMHRFDERGELAPRDIVARAIDHEMKRIGLDHLYLDISHKPSAEIKEHFPTIYQRCLKLGIDITKDPIPVVPAAHYTCGGIKTDLNGRTSVNNLYAIGESSCTGLHGANRLASNSLLECIVMGRAAAEDILRQKHQSETLPEAPEWDESQVTDSDEDVVISHNWLELRRFMWDYVGIVRTNKRLQRAKHRVDLLRGEIHEFYSNYKVSADLLELRNLVDVADLIIRSALRRQESRGLHYSLDYQDLLEDAKDTVITPEKKQ